ncbi:MAG: general secretion pathway protein GspK [Bacillota bacterium]
MNRNRYATGIGGKKRRRGSRMPGKDCRGSALVMVIVLTVILSGILLFLLYRMEMETALVHNQRERLQFQRTAMDILQREINLLRIDETRYDAKGEDEWWQPAFTDDSIKKIKVTVTDECGKINLNSLTYLQAVALFKNDILYEPLLDWRDPPGESFAKGAELPYYKSKGEVYPDFDGIFRNINVLERIRNADKFPKDIKEYTTVYGYLNPNFIDGATFVSVLADAGVEKHVAERMDMELSIYQVTNRYFRDLDELEKLPSMNVDILAKLKNLLTFGPVYNINTIDPRALRVLWPGGEDEDQFKAFLKERKKTIFKKQDEVDEFVYKYVPDNIKQEVEQCKTQGGLHLKKVADAFLIIIDNGNVSYQNLLGVESNFLTVTMKFEREKGPALTIRTTLERYMKITDTHYRVRLHTWQMEDERHA